MLVLRWTWYAGAWFIIKMLSYQYRKSHCGDKTIVISSYLHNGISYTGKMTSLYWISGPRSLFALCYHFQVLYLHIRINRNWLLEIWCNMYIIAAVNISTPRISDPWIHRNLASRVILVRISSLVICAALCKITVSPLLKYWKYCSLALNLRYMFIARSPLAVHAIFAAANGLVPNSHRPTTAIILPNQPFFPELNT